MLDQQTITKPEAEKAKPRVESSIAKWQARIEAAKQKFECDFQRMRDDMEFVGGIQLPGQEDLNDERYIANITLREINQKVAALYARNPKAEATRRDRMDFAIWDGKTESLVQAAHALMSGMPDPMSMALVQDYTHGIERQVMIDRIAKTLQLEYQIQIDRQEPDFKLQMKQLVRRTEVCGVGFVRVCFKREGRRYFDVKQTNEPLTDRIGMLSQLTKEYDDGTFDENNPKFEQMRLLLNSIQYAMSDSLEVRDLNERLVFEFPSATSMIIDPECTILKGFVGAKWIVQEHMKPVEDVRAFFEKPELKVGGGDARGYTKDGVPVPPGSTSVDDTKVAVWEVFNKEDRTRFFVCDGYKDYLLEPEEVTPCVQRFWHHIALTFNDMETEPGLKVSIYPPSDVRLLMSPQKEWNITKQRLKEHRTSNKPKYLTATGWLSDEDKDALRSGHKPGAVIEIRGVPPGTDIGKMLAPFQHSPIDPALYSTEPLERDILLTTGSQQANLGPITNRGTATEATISEQSRTTAVGSNVDDLDDCLTEMARCGGEMMLREMSIQTIKRDCGVGATWPMADREDYVDRIYLQVAAASTGRPNKGLEVANFQALAPLLMQAGANPQFLVREGVKRLDDRLDVNEAFPVIPPGAVSAPASSQPPSKGTQGRSATPNATTAGPSAPLPVPSDATQSNYDNPT